MAIKSVPAKHVHKIWKFINKLYKLQASAPENTMHVLYIAICDLVNSLNLLAILQNTAMATVSTLVSTSISKNDHKVLMYN